MSNEILNKPVVYEVNGQEVKLTGGMVKNYLTRGNDTVSEQEIVMFINLCKYQKLNPFLNEAYLVKFKGAPAQLITSKEAYMKRAFDHPKFDGIKAGIIVQRGEETLELEGSFSLPGDQLLGGWAEVYVKDKKYPYITKINIDEFNKGQATWKAMPKTMIRKTALVQALREAFPDNLGAMYTDDEQVIVKETNTVEVEVAEEIQQNANNQVIDIEEDEITEEKNQKQPRKDESQKATSGSQNRNQGQHNTGKQQSANDLYEDPGF
ncbi:phage recombination protein Bet [Alkaliphilus metalliredigens QYMF]|uniref:Phage recombination protein Bet n=1 Tax=Alkaliphilus metalliredigens (strain QYMF) TaxID=293826 RepID=A6TRD8_ALKMQ|nr:phage recombination protein Bet [Alkaliphilus metalliredigens]ABR48756.1 phage recombination protein Bet [Alkaliphilus metalliredigens QYMF]